MIPREAHLLSNHTGNNFLKLYLKYYYDKINSKNEST